MDPVLNKVIRIGDRYFGINRKNDIGDKKQLDLDSVILYYFVCLRQGVLFVKVPILM